MDDFSKHEVLDRACLVMNLFVSSVIEHEVVETDEELKLAANKTFDALWDFYQLCGKRFL